MNPSKSGKPSINKIYQITFQLLKKHLFFYAPFIIFAIFEFLALLVFYLAPRMPLILVLGPPIRTFWGEGFLHYPANFLLLPKLTSLSRMALSIVVGSLLSGMAVAIILAIYNEKLIKLKESFKSALKKYISLLTVVFIITVLYYYLIKISSMSLTKYFLTRKSGFLFLNLNFCMGAVLILVNLLLAVFIQSVFVYAIPILMIEKEKLIRSIFKSFLLFRKLFIPTIILVALPSLIYIPIAVLNYNIAFLIDKVYPEFVLVVLFFSIFLSSLIVDPIMTFSTAVLYLLNREISLEKKEI